MSEKTCVLEVKVSALDIDVVKDLIALLRTHCEELPTPIKEFIDALPEGEE